MTEEKKDEGWGNPNMYKTGRTKFHYFRDGISLCGKWFRLPGSFILESGSDQHRDNCKACSRKKLAEPAPNIPLSYDPKNSVY